MKFRAGLRDAQPLHALCSVIKSFSRRALLKLHATQLRIIALPADTATAMDGAQVWASMRADAVFGDIRVESKHDNSVYCEVPDMAALCWVLKQCERQVGVVMKLAKVGSRQILSVSIQQGRVDAVHEVPIRVLPDAEIARIQAPPLAEDVAAVLLPPLADIAAFVDCARTANCATCTLTLAPTGAPPAGATALHHDEDLLADAPGRATTAALALVAEGPTLTFDSQYATVHAAPGTTISTAQPQISVAVDVRRLSRFMAVRDMHPSQVVGHVDHRRALVITVAAASGSNLIFYLPAVIRG